MSAVSSFSPIRSSKASVIKKTKLIHLPELHYSPRQRRNSGITLDELENTLSLTRKEIRSTQLNLNSSTNHESNQSSRIFQTFKPKKNVSFARDDMWIQLIEYPKDGWIHDIKAKSQIKWTSENQNATAKKAKNNKQKKVTCSCIII